MSEIKLADDIAWKVQKGFFSHHLAMLPQPYSSQDSNRITLSYFVLSALDVLDSMEKVDRKTIIDWIYSLQIHPDKAEPGKNKRYCGWRGGSYIGHPFDVTGESHRFIAQDKGHIAMTYVALAQLLILGDDLSRVEKKAVVAALPFLQQENGSFSPVADGSENDMRYLYCACCISYMLNDWSGVNRDLASKYILESMTYENGIGQGPGEEAHAGSTYCAIASLALMGRLGELDEVKREHLVEWLIMRQSLGFNGRPNKIPDTCYSFWAGATLVLLGQFDLVVFKHTRSFTMSCQKKIGGFGKHADAFPDVLHSYFSLCGLSFIGEPGLQKVHPGLGFTQRAHDRLGQIHGAAFVPMSILSKDTDYEYK